MTFYRVSSAGLDHFLDGEFEPYPRNLIRFLTIHTPIDGYCVEVVRGETPPDLMMAAFNVVSERFVRVLLEARASGWRSAPIQVVDTRRGNAPIPGYHLLRVLGQGGPIDDVASHVRRGQFGSLDGYRGLYVVPGHWDGSDVFSIGGTACIEVVPRIAEALQRAALQNVVLTRNDECVM